MDPLGDADKRTGGSAVTSDLASDIYARNLAALATLDTAARRCLEAHRPIQVQVTREIDELQGDS